MSQAVLQDGKIFVGKSVKPEYLDLTLANRHGLITGATGTGKTVTLQVLAEGFSRAGVPVFAADIKGDLSGIAEVGEPKDFLLKRAAEVGLENLQERRVAGRAVGRVRRRRPSDPRHRRGHGAAAPVAHAGAQRRAGGRAQHRLPRRLRGEAAAHQSRRPARHHQQRGVARQGADDQVRQRGDNVGRRHPAPPPGARRAGRQSLLRRAGARHLGLHPHGARRPRRRQHPVGRKADGEAAPLRDVPFVDADQAVADAARGRRSAQAEARVLLR